MQRAGGSALEIGFLDHRGQRLLSHLAGVQKGWKAVATTQLGDPLLNGAGADLPVALTAALALVDSPSLRSPRPAPFGPPSSRAIGRSAAKPVMSHSRSASEDFSERPREAIVSSGFVRHNPYPPRGLPRWPLGSLRQGLCHARRALARLSHHPRHDQILAVQRIRHEFKCSPIARSRQLDQQHAFVERAGARHADASDAWPADTNATISWD